VVKRSTSACEAAHSTLSGHCGGKDQAVLGWRVDRPLHSDARHGRGRTRKVVEAGPGDFLRVPAGAVNLQSNPGHGTSRAVIVRCGTGTPTINVDGRAPSGEG
jgi:hypothetical protein